MNQEFNGPKRSSIVDQWKYLALNGSTPSSVYRTTKNSKYFVRRLTIKEEISGHNGCVNTVHWNKSGTILLSGSDDRHLNLYSYPTFRLAERIKSGHRANIFNAKFIPHSNDTKICSCSGDGIMHFNNLMDKKSYGKNPFKCHVGIVYDVIIHNQDPNGFLSCGEDGTVRYFDLRTTSSCNCSHCDKHTLLDIKQPITTCALNPFNPNEVVVGCDDSTIRAYDRRFRFTQGSKKITQIGRPQSNSYPPIDPTTTGLIYSFRPTANALDINSNSSHYSNRLTCLTFNWKGDEILASYCPSLLTLFSTTPKLSPTVAECNSTRSSLFDECFLFPGGITPESSKPTKRLVPFIDKNETEERVWEMSPFASTNSSDDSRNDQNQALLGGRPIRPNHESSTPITDSTSQNHSPYSIVTLDEESPLPQNVPTTDEDNDNATDTFDQSHVEEIIDLPPDLDDVPELYQLSSSNSNQTSDNESYTFSPLQATSESPQLSTHRLSSTNVASVPNVVAAVAASNSNEVQVENFNSNTSDASQMTTDNSSHQHEVGIDIVDHSTPIDNTGGHSNRTAPLPRTRSVVSSEIYTNTTQNNSQSDTYGAELTNETTTSTQFSHHVGSAPSMDSHSLPSGDGQNRGESQKLTKNPDSRYSAWDCASSSYSKTCIADSTARGPNVPTPNPPDMYYNPTFFNSIDSLTTIGQHDRLRAYIDNLFVPNYVINYRGHHNSRTMIKECNFYGDDYVMSGSDDGNVFIWDKWSSQLVNVFNADNNVVNCLQPHPTDPVIACSGIDSSIKIIAPVRKTAVPVRDINSIIASNERELRGSSSYYFDATPTMIFHVLLALERIQRNRGDDITNQNDQPNTDNLRDVDPVRVTREGFRRNARTRNPAFGNSRRVRRTTNRHSAEDTPDPSSHQDVDLDSFFESDIYDDDDDQEYSMESSSGSQVSSSSSPYRTNNDDE